MKDTAAPDVDPDAVPVGGAMGAALRARDWSATPLGPLESWPPALRTLVEIILGSGQPMFVTWGPDRTLLYNDGYAPILGRRHPSALGRPMAEVWPEIWSELAPLFDQVDAGRPIHMDDIALVMHRHGYPEEAHFAFSYTPVRDETGRVAGMFCACTETTAQVMATRALRESEEQNRAVIESAHDYAIFTTDLNGLITSWSPGAQATFGWSPEAALGQAADVIFTEEDRAAGAPARELTTAAADGCANDERWHVRRDGSRVFMNGSARPLLHADGSLRGFIKIARDETEQRRSAEILVENERRFREVADAAPVMLWITNPDGVCIYLNKPWYAFTGQTEDEAQGYGWLDATHPDDKPRSQAIFVDANARRAPFYVEYRLRRADGGYSWAIDMAQPRFDPEGNYLGYVGAVIDISERKAAEEALREGEARFRTLADAVPAFVWFANPEGAITWYNARWYAYTGLTEAQSVGAGWVSTLHPDDALAAAAAWEEARARGYSYVVECRHRRTDGAYRWYVVRAEPVRDEAGRISGWFGTSTDIDDRKQAEAALRESEEHYRFSVELNPQVAWTAAPDGQLDRVAQRWEGWTGSSGLGETWGQVIHPDDLPPSVEAWMRSVTTGAPYDIEHRVRLRSGEHHWMRSRALPRRDGEGRILRWYGNTEDIHERKLAEAGLAESRARLLSMMDALPVGVLMAEAPTGRLVMSNRFMDTLIRRPVRKTDGPPDYAAREAFDSQGRPMADGDWPIQRVLATGRPAEAEVRFRRGDGSYGWRRTPAAPVRNPGGGVAGAVAGVTDLNEIMEAREVLSRSREELERAVDARTRERDRIWRLSKDLLGVADAEGRWLSVNPAWVETLGWEEGAILGKGSEWLEHPDDRAASRAELAGGHTLRFENRLRTRNGTYRWISWTAVPQEGLTYAVGRDVTEAREQAGALARVEDQLRQAQKMEAVGQLTGGVAHDFNNLLQIVVGNLELLNRSLPADAARQRRSVDNAMNGAKRAVTLTQRLLAFSRRQPLDPKPVSVNKLVAGMSELLSRALGETIEIETVLAAGLWRADVDGGQLENAILNLAVNARDAMPEGGRLTLETANTRLDESYVQQNVEVAPGQYVVICVSDTGVGMDKEVAARVFEPFFTTKEVGKGTGLGLSQVYGFVKQSGGHVKIYSERGDGESRGTTVKIYLPRYLGSADEEAEVLEPDAPEGGPEETILVVEDDPDVRAYTVEVLRELGYRVVEAGDAHSALKLLRDASTRCDLLFTDVVLPGGLNGEQLAEAAHDARPGLKVLFTTGYARNAIVHQGRLGQGVRLITKPFTYADLAARVRDVLDEAPL